MIELEGLETRIDKISYYIEHGLQMLRSWSALENKSDESYLIEANACLEESKRLIKLIKRENYEHKT